MFRQYYCDAIMAAPTGREGAKAFLKAPSATGVGLSWRYEIERFWRQSTAGHVIPPLPPAASAATPLREGG